MEFALEGAFPVPDSDDDDDEEEDGKSADGTSKSAQVAAQTPWLDIQRAREICVEGAKTTELHLSQSHQTWGVLRDLELRILQSDPKNQAQIDRVRSLYLARLKVPHAALSETFSDYSPFETSVDSGSYVENMRAASLIKSKAESEYHKYDRFEMKLVGSH
jgi:hypothetical protein